MGVIIPEAHALFTSLLNGLDPKAVKLNEPVS